MARPRGTSRGSARSGATAGGWVSLWETYGPRTLMAFGLSVATMTIGPWAVRQAGKAIYNDPSGSGGHGGIDHYRNMFDHISQTVGDIGLIATLTTVTLGAGLAGATVLGRRPETGLKVGFGVAAAVVGIWALSRLGITSAFIPEEARGSGDIGISQIPVAIHPAGVVHAAEVIVPAVVGVTAPHARIRGK